MRLYLYLFLSMFLFSCQIDLEDENTRLEKLPVFEIQTPPSMIVDFEYTITFKYALPNGCYAFYDIDVEYNNLPNKNVRVITAFAEVATNTYCTEQYSEESFSFPFKPEESKTYLFEFWIGQNSQGIDQFEEFELVVE